jgi:hypothetical protein
MLAPPPAPPAPVAAIVSLECELPRAGEIWTTFNGTFEITPSDGWVITDNRFTKTQPDGIEISISRHTGVITVSKQSYSNTGTFRPVTVSARRF